MVWLPDNKRLRICLPVSTQYTNVTDRRTLHDSVGRACSLTRLQKSSKYLFCLSPSLFVDQSTYDHWSAVLLWCREGEDVSGSRQVGVWNIIGRGTAPTRRLRGWLRRRVGTSITQCGGSHWTRPGAGLSLSARQPSTASDVWYLSLSFFHLTVVSPIHHSEWVRKWVIICSISLGTYNEFFQGVDRTSVNKHSACRARK